MVKFLLSLIIFLFIVPTSVSAAMVNINPDGQIIWAVLSAQDAVEFELPERESVEVTSVISVDDPTPQTKVTLRNNDGKVKLSVNTGDGERTADVTGYTKEIVEIEERNKPKTVKILATDLGFKILQGPIAAVTEFPININPDEHEVSIETRSGDRFLAVLPFEAVSNLIKTQMINRVIGEDVQLIEGEAGELVYSIEGEKDIHMFNLFTLAAPVTTSVSASTGQVLNVDQPAWLGVLSFLFA